MHLPTGNTTGPAPDDKRAAKLRKQRVAALQGHLNKCRMDISLGKLKTYEDVFARLGLSPTDPPWAGKSGPVTVSKFGADIETPLSLQLAAKFRAEITAATQPTTNEPPTILPATDPAGGASEAQPEADGQAPEHDPPDEEDETHPVEHTEYWQEDLPTRKCTLFRHQRHDAQCMLYNLYVLNRRAYLLKRGVGAGKTFSYFEVISQLWRLNWFRGRSFSPWPVCIVTKASIVEQTRRVGIERFGLDPHRQFKVINYDALRASAGKSMITTTTIVEDGIPRKRWDWQPGVHPMLFILDEGQSAKNETSQQSEICQAIARIQDPNLRVVVASATPFMRVSEAKYFVLNCHLEYSVI